ncbi:MAG: signal peptidase II [Planctomycetes bacterium]|nr:signal peptidase II [Planctomycetota bacterium]MBI3843975.1 signal peptidase II [Planctomycetota bacterium]
MMRRWTIKAAMAAVVASTVGCDQVSKSLATAHLMGGPRRSFVGDMLRLEYAENAGAFLSLGAGWAPWARTAVFSVGTAIILVACIVWAFRHRWSLVRLLGLSLVIAGGLSNLADRVVRGSVVDFLNVGIGPLRTGIFNVADMAILLGIGLVVLTRGWRAEGRQPVA